MTTLKDDHNSTVRLTKENLTTYNVAHALLNSAPQEVINQLNQFIGETKAGYIAQASINECNFNAIIKDTLENRVENLSKTIQVLDVLPALQPAL